MYDPTLAGAMRMEAAERRRGIQRGDDCKQCDHYAVLWDKAYCTEGYKISKQQFHRCNKHKIFVRVSG